MCTEDFGLELAKAAAEAAGKESVNKIAEAIKTLFPFLGLKREAIETYVAEIQKSNLSPEAKLYAISHAKMTYKQLKNQTAIAKIALESAKEGTDFSDKSKVDNEWLERFLDSAKFVSDEQIQLLWGNILAKEFETPNSTPPSVVRILSEITPVYAKAFQTLCSLSISIVPVNEAGEYLPEEENSIILPSEYEYLNKYGVDFSTLNELEMLGLIKFEGVTGFVLTFQNNTHRFRVTYGPYAATVMQKADELPTGEVVLTKAGESISRFVDRHIISEHFDAVRKYMEDNGVKFSEFSKPI